MCASCLSYPHFDRLDIERMSSRSAARVADGTGIQSVVRKEKIFKNRLPGLVDGP